MTELISWTDSLSLGIEEIDLQHKKLLLIAGEIYTIALLPPDQYKLKMPKAVKQVTDYTVYHFTSEEEFMRKFGYAQADFHKSQHDGFISAVSRQIEKLNNSNPADGMAFYDYLGTWVFNHIAKADKVWASFVKKIIKEQNG